MVAPLRINNGGTFLLHFLVSKYVGVRSYCMFSEVYHSALEAVYIHLRLGLILVKLCFRDLTGCEDLLIARSMLLMRDAFSLQLRLGISGASRISATGLRFDCDHFRTNFYHANIGDRCRWISIIAAQKGIDLAGLQALNYDHHRIRSH